MTTPTQTQEIKKCIQCANALWPMHKPGWCITHNATTDAARAAPDQCKEAQSFVVKSADGTPDRI